MPHAKPIHLVLSSTPVILRQLSWQGFRRLDLRVRKGKTGPEILELVAERTPDAVLLQSNLPDKDALAMLEEIRATSETLPVIIVHMHGSLDPRWAQAGNCTVVGSPLGRGQLYDVLTPYLALPHAIQQTARVVAEPIDHRPSIDMVGQVISLTVSGARIVVPEPLDERARLMVYLESGATTSELAGRTVWCRTRAHQSHEGHDAAAETTEAELSVQFTELDDETRALLRRITTWKLTDGPQGTRVELLRGLTELSDLSDLPELLSGSVEIDLSNVNPVYSVGITRWIKFLRQISTDVDYRFVNCSTSFCSQASAFPELFGSGRVESLYASYCCVSCSYEGERLLRVDELQQDDKISPPIFPCPWCDGKMSFDDIPERHFSFLRKRTR